MDRNDVKTENTIWFLAKLFLVFGGAFTVLTGVFEELPNGRVSGLLFRGAFFGGFMAACVGFFHLLLGGRPGVNGAVSVVQSATATMVAPMDDALDVARSALARIPARRIRIVQGDVPVMLARTPITFSSLGENIRLSFEPTPDGFVQVRVQSQPWFRSTICDFGKNLSNVETILGALEEKTTDSEVAPDSRHSP